jgi:hypothetical protein
VSDKEIDIPHYVYYSPELDKIVLDYIKQPYIFYHGQHSASQTTGTITLYFIQYFYIGEL